MAASVYLILLRYLICIKVAKDLEFALLLNHKYVYIICCEAKINSWEIFCYKNKTSTNFGYCKNDKAITVFAKAVMQNTVVSKLCQNFHETPIVDSCSITAGLR